MKEIVLFVCSIVVACLISIPALADNIPDTHDKNFCAKFEGFAKNECSKHAPEVLKFTCNAFFLINEGIGAGDALWASCNAYSSNEQETNACVNLWNYYRSDGHC